VVKCPKCGKENPSPAREWTGGKKPEGDMKVQRFVCSSCATSFVAWVDRTGKFRVMTR
jgi:transposase-like protein